MAARPQDDSDIGGIIDGQRDSIDSDHRLNTARTLGDAIDIARAGRVDAARHA